MSLIIEIIRSIRNARRKPRSTGEADRGHVHAKNDSAIELHRQAIETLGQGAAAAHSWDPEQNRETMALKSCTSEEVDIVLPIDCGCRC